MNGPRTWISPIVLPSHGASLAVVGADAHVDQRHRHAGHRGAPEALLVAGVLQSSRTVRDRRERRGLGHAPALDDPDAVLREGADQRLRHRRAADQRAHARAAASSGRAARRARGRRPGSGPSRSSARRARASAARAAIRSSRSSGCRCGPGKTSFAPEHHRAVRHAPAVGVEHRRHRQQHVGTLQAPVVGRGSRPGCAAPSSGANRRRPSAGRSCPTCSTSRPGRSRRAAA